jgi:hypothetical protein
VQNEIYPIVGIAFEGHKLQLLALLTFLEVERRSEALGERSNIAEKGKRDVKNLESAVNYEARGTSSSRRNRKPRGGIQLCYEAKNQFRECEGTEQEEKTTKD